jgi:hypothetical protein
MPFASDSFRFDGGPPLRLERCLGLVKPDDRCTRRRVFLAVSIGWAPLAILSAVRQAVTGDGSFWSFVQDFGAHSRFLIAVPLLITADSWCLPRLSRISEHFFNSGIVTGEDREKLRTELASTNRLLNSIWAEMLAVIAAYVAVLGLILAVPFLVLPEWQAQQDNVGFTFTAAGRWHVLVSIPLLILLFFGWVWRQFVWLKLLRSISRLDLQLIPAHPDHVGGLGFMGSALRGYWPLCLAFATVVAGRMGNDLWRGSTLYESRFMVAGLFGFILVFFLVPFIVFMPKLRQLRERGQFVYGSLGLSMGREFEGIWLKGRTSFSREILEKQDFSATTDLYSIIGNTHDIRYFPIPFRPIRELMLITLLPFAPVVLSVVPFEVLITEMTKLVL